MYLPSKPQGQRLIFHATSSLYAAIGDQASGQDPVVTVVTNFGPCSGGGSRVPVRRLVTNY
jgi:hypothetical protein